MKNTLVAVVLCLASLVAWAQPHGGGGGGTPYVPSNVAITGGNIDGTIIGGTTPAAGTFTSLIGTTLNGNIFTAGTYTLTGSASKTLTFNNSLTLAGTDSTTMTFPTTSATIARRDAGQTFTGANLFAAGTDSAPGIAINASTLGFAARTTTAIDVVAAGAAFIVFNQPNSSINIGNSNGSLNNGYIGFSSGDPSSIGADTILTRRAAGAMAMANGANPNEFDVYGTTTGPKYMFIKHDGTNGTVDTAASSGQLNIGTTNATNVTIGTSSGGVKIPSGVIATGSTPTLTGTCTTGSQVGGNTAGKFTATCTGQTVIITFATTAPNGWVCNSQDITTVADALKQTAFTTTSCTLTGTTVASDVIVFNATGF